MTPASVPSKSPRLLGVRVRVRVRARLRLRLRVRASFRVRVGAGTCGSSRGLGRCLGRLAWKYLFGRVELARSSLRGGKGR